MANKNVRVETDNIKTVMKEMTSKIEEIEEMLRNTKVKIEDSKKIFDTPTASYFRQKVYDDMDEQQLFITNDIRPLVEVLGTIADAYEKDFEKELNLIDFNKKSNSINIGGNNG